MRVVRAHCVFLSVLLSALALDACGGDENNGDSQHPTGLQSTGLTCKSLCPTILACKPDTTQQDCEDMCDLVVLSDACLEAMETAECSDHAKDHPGYRDTCFPPCDSSTPPSCQDDTVANCQEGELVRFRCEVFCEINGGSYAGACSDTFDGRPSSSGYEICWCNPK